MPQRTKMKRYTSDATSSKPRSAEAKKSGHDSGGQLLFDFEGSRCGMQPPDGWQAQDQLNHGPESGTAC
jgi:hypothetical protein